MGFVPDSFLVALIMVIVSMFGWGSWSTTLKKIKGVRFEFWYVIYMLSFMLFVTISDFTLGMIGAPTFLDSLYAASSESIANGLLSGAIWNIGNFFLVVAVVLVGFGFAGPIAIGIAIVLGSLSSYFVNPVGNFPFFLTGVALLVVGILLDSLAYRFRGNKISKKISTINWKKGLIATVVSAIFLGLFPYFYSLSTQPAGTLTPYTGVFFFSLGAFITLPLILFFIKRPVTGGKGLQLRNLFRERKQFYLWGLVAGLIWTVGTVLNFAAANVVGFAISFSMGNSAAMVTAIWGIFVFKELKNAPRKSWLMISLMFLAFILGMSFLSLAYVYA